MKIFSFWLKAIALPVVLLAVGSVVVLATYSSNYAPGSQERCAELYQKIYASETTAAAPAYTADEKAEYLKYCVTQATPTTTSTDQQAYPSYTCDELKRIIESGQYSSEEKALYSKCLEGEAIPYQGEGGQTDVASECESWMYIMKKYSQTPNSSEYLNAKTQYNKLCENEAAGQPTVTQVGDQAQRDCEALRSVLEKLSADPNSQDYADTKAKYVKMCYQQEQEDRAQLTPPTAVTQGESVNYCEKLKNTLASGQYTAEEKALYAKLCLNEKPIVPENQFCEKMKALLESGDGYTAEDKMMYYKVCLQQTATPTFAPETDQCKELRAKMVALNNSGQANTQDYLNLKASFLKLCEKAKVVPPAGYEDVVLTNPDSYNNPFPDTNTKDREGKAAAELYRRGVIGGFPDGEFKGERPVNRAEAAKFLLLACAKNTEADYSGKFRDVMKGQWYVPFVEAAARLGIIKGYPDGSFRPANTVNRAEFAKMITLACQLPENLDYSLFTDVKEGDWFAVYAGAVQKYSLYPDSVVDNLFKPANLMTRSEVAIAIYQHLTNR